MVNIHCHKIWFFLRSFPLLKFAPQESIACIGGMCGQPIINMIWTNKTKRIYNVSRLLIIVNEFIQTQNDRLSPTLLEPDIFSKGSFLFALRQTLHKMPRASQLVRLIEPRLNANQLNTTRGHIYPILRCWFAHTYFFFWPAILATCQYSE